MHSQSSRHIYALLVGIDRYPAPIPSLQGCVNDSIALQQYLKDRVYQEHNQLHLVTLQNEAATRQAIVDGFRQHLCRAGQNDVALFAYSGHGSQAAAPPELWHLEPDRLNETLVCYDSRTETSWDLADIELDQLIAEVAERNPHITIILDCCHSQSGTRDWQTAAVRQIPVDERERPVSSYIISSNQTIRAIAPPSPESQLRQLRRGRHIVLAACRERETAKEYGGSGEKRGAFSYFLIDTLKRAKRPLSYRDLFNQARALVLLTVADQNPQLEATHLEDLEQPFLGGAIAPCPAYFTVSYHNHYRWVINGGAVHGLLQTVGEDAIELAVFPLDCSPEQLQHIQEAIARATVTEVLSHLSRVHIQTNGDRSFDSTQTYKAVVTHQPLPPTLITLEGESAGVKQLHQMLSTSDFKPNSSFSLHVTDNRESAEFRVLARNEHYWIIRSSDEHPLVAPIASYTPSSTTQVLQQLNHIIRWFRIANLTSSITSQIAPNAVQLWVEWHTGDTIERYQATDLPDGHVLLQYRGTQKPTFRVKLTNTSQQPLYCALVNLTGRFSIHTNLLAGGGVWLESGQEVWAYFGRLMYGMIPDELWQQGVTEYRDILKLIVSTAEFDATLLEQDRLGTLYSRSVSQSSQNRGTLNRLLSQITTRDLEPQADFHDDWMTSQVLFHLVRPQPTQPISTSAPTVLGHGVTLAPHPSFQAQVRLTTISHINRTLKCNKTNLLDELCYGYFRAALEPFWITPSTGNNPGLSALEFSDINDYTSINSTNPLTIWIDTQINHDEQIIAIAHNNKSSHIVSQSYSKGKTIEINLEFLSNFNTENSIDDSAILYVELFKIKKTDQDSFNKLIKTAFTRAKIKLPEIPLESSKLSNRLPDLSVKSENVDHVANAIPKSRKIKFTTNKYFWQTSTAIAMIMLLVMLGIRLWHRFQQAEPERQSSIIPKLTHHI